jgi:hypothetical protein
MTPLPKLLPVIVLAATVCASNGCGGNVTGAGLMGPPISVSLIPSQVVVPLNGTPVHVAISIKSPSETALVNLVGLPGGVQEMYAASDTNPSGSLTFTATMTAMAGTYMPTIVVNSAGQTASVKFTLVVGTATSMAEP